MKHLLAMAVMATSLTAAAPTFAHHSFSMFDPSQEIVITGTVQRWAFNSPHTFMILEDEEGTVWAFEGAGPPNLIALDPPMVGDTFQTGQPLTVVYCPLRDGRNGGAAGAFITEDGTAYNPADGGCRGGRVAQWPGWIEQGFTSLAEVEAAGLLDEEAE